MHITKPFRYKPTKDRTKQLTHSCGCMPVMVNKSIFYSHFSWLRHFFNLHPQEYFSNELALVIRDIRAEYEAINEAQRGADTDGWYKAKFNEMMAASQRASGDLASSKEEVIYSTLRCR